MNTDWMRVGNVAEVASPALLIYPERIEENFRRMIRIAGDPARLRPHLKTHKLPQLIVRQVALGITKCKCATLAEAEMAAAAGAPDVFLAAQLTGPNVWRFVALMQAFPRTGFCTMTDDEGSIQSLNAAALSSGVVIDLLVDLDVGQHRTGVAPDAAAVALYRMISDSPGLRCAGLHAYDGHVHQSDLVERAAAADAVGAEVEKLRGVLVGQGMTVPRIVMGGTPTFPAHARRAGAAAEYSPGTCVLWDAGYGARFPDLDFLPAAVLLTRVVSQPAAGRLCLDLGYKAVSSEMAHPRVIFPLLPEAKAVAQNEEHLVLETPRAAEFPVGSVLLGVPWHVCPTVALHDRVQVVRDGRVAEEWPVVGRARRLTI